MSSRPGFYEIFRGKDSGKKVTGMNGYVVEMNNIRKSFGSVQAVKDGQFNLKKGEIHSLIGENGTGKSTMMKLLYGLYDFDGGDIKIKGENMSHITPKIAIEKGIGMVHQEFMLVSELTVLENIILGFEPRKGCTIDFDKAKNTVQHYIDQYGMDIQMSKKINQISVGEAQRVEIIKILTRGADVIILDEPTAVLTPQETRRLFEILENLRKDGKSIVFISHKLNEVMEISDRITVMRQGCFIGTDKTPLPHYGNTVRYLHYLIEFMRDENNGLAILSQILQNLKKSACFLRRQHSCRFIQYDYICSPGQYFNDLHSLGFSHGNLIYFLTHLYIHAVLVYIVLHCIFCFIKIYGASLSGFKSQDNILQYCKLAYQHEFLVHHAYSFFYGNLGGDVAHILTFDFYISPVKII